MYEFRKARKIKFCVELYNLFKKISLLIESFKISSYQFLFKKISKPKEIKSIFNHGSKK